VVVVFTYGSIFGGFIYFWLDLWWYCLLLVRFLAVLSTSRSICGGGFI
jgi:hypothetical protein